MVGYGVSCYKNLEAFKNLCSRLKYLQAKNNSIPFAHI